MHSKNKKPIKKLLVLKWTKFHLNLRNFEYYGVVLLSYKKDVYTRQILITVPRCSYDTVGTTPTIELTLNYTTHDLKTDGFYARQWRRLPPKSGGGGLKQTGSGGGAPGKSVRDHALFF